MRAAARIPTHGLKLLHRHIGCAIPQRSSIMTRLTAQNDPYDVLIIGGGATGAGSALDAAIRKLKIVCVERGDFGSGTSSRSTKLLWYDVTLSFYQIKDPAIVRGGSRYLVEAFTNLLSSDLRLLRKPKDTLLKFSTEFKMVLNCHRERHFLLMTQPHLTQWMPIAVPLTKWILWPPPFHFGLASIGPLGLFPAFFKFYDALSGFTCPPSHIMTPTRARRIFPQLAAVGMKYCSVFYEGQHDDARTNLSIAQTAAVHGADIVNYCEVMDFLKDPITDKIIGAIVNDTISGKVFTIMARTVLVCGGPYTDAIRRLSTPGCPRAVQGSVGTHIVIPGYFAPKNMGLVDMNTSDGRFLFFLPWQGHVLIGTTDRPITEVAPLLPKPSEEDIQWLVREGSKYLDSEVKLRREDVLSAWSGVRPLARVLNQDDDTSASTATSAGTVSRDHVIHHDKVSGLIFAAGGKWTTYREMSQDAIDKVVEVIQETTADKKFENCQTLHVDLIGKKGFTSNMNVRLAQEHGVTIEVANRFSSCYGGRARDVLDIAFSNGMGHELLVQGFHFLKAEVVFAARHDWAEHADDVLGRRTRLAFVNKAAAQQAVPSIVAIMAAELKWDSSRQLSETERCREFLETFGGSESAPSNAI